MNVRHFEYQESCQVSSEQIASLMTSLLPELQRMQKARHHGYDTEYACLNVPFDDAMSNTVQAMVTAKKALNPTLVVVVGIGGSHLGTYAVYQALYGTLYNQVSDQVKLYCADTVAPDYIHEIICVIEQELQKKQGQVIINLVSKSGSTTESIANFEIFLALIQHHRSSYKECIVVTTDEGSPLWQLAQQEGFSCLPIPPTLGGRYSVFSPVGLFPLALVGVDCTELRAGARAAVTSVLESDPTDNPAVITALLLAWYYKQGIRIHDTFLFDPALEGIGKWYRQLLAESVGKESTQEGTSVGITPTVSLGSTDLHSVGQLYLGGPHNFFTTFVTVQSHAVDVRIPNYPQYHSLVANIQGRSLATLMDAIYKGVSRAYGKGNRPFVVWKLAQKNPFYIAQLLQYKMFEVLYVCFLLRVNPFNQPQVELYKQETRRILSDE